MLSRKTIEPGTLELLKSLMLEPEFSQLRLVGETSLALQYGHRVSIDLDFFGEIQTDDDTIKSILHKYGALKVIKESANIKVYILNNIKIDIVNYNYKWIDAPLIEEDIRLATPKDIAAMKVNAIAGRGSKKDFIDMYFLLQHFSLSDIISFYEEKYPESSVFRALMSLTYFEDAEEQIMPKMFSDTSWDTVKEHIIKTVSKYKLL